MENYNQLLKELKHKIVLDIECILHEPCFDLSIPHELHRGVYGFCDNSTHEKVIEAVTIEDGDAVATHLCSHSRYEFDEVFECKVEDFTIETLLKLLGQVKKDCRGLKIQELRNIISKAGGYIKFDGKEGFLFCDNPQISDNMDAICHHLDEVRILGFDNVEFVTPEMNCDVNQVPDGTLDKIIGYIKEKQNVDIELTDEQLKVMDGFYNAIKKMRDAGITVIRDAAIDGGFYFVNGKGLEFSCDGYCDLDGFFSIQNQISAMEIFSYGDLSDYVFDSSIDDLYAKRI